MRGVEEAEGDFYDRNGLRGRLSVGCAVFRPGEDAGIADVIERADEAMYRMKKAKKERGNGEKPPQAP